MFVRPAQEGNPFLDEDKTVRAYMLIHGITNVRGGTYCGNANGDLEQWQIIALQEDLTHAQNK